MKKQNIVTGTVLHKMISRIKKKILYKAFMLKVLLLILTISFSIYIYDLRHKYHDNYDQNSETPITQARNPKDEYYNHDHSPVGDSTNLTPDNSPPDSSSQNPTVPSKSDIVETANTSQSTNGSSVLVPSVITPSKVQPVNISTTTMLSGQLLSIEIPALTADQIYEIDLSGYSFSNLAFMWPDGNLYYNLTDSSDSTQLSPVPLADDIQQFEDGLVSELLYPSLSERDYLYISSDQDLGYLKIDLIDPTPSSTSLSVATLSSTKVYNRDSGAKYTTLNIISRDEWGANPAGWDPYNSSNIDDPNRLVWVSTYHPVYRIVVHHTAGTNYPSDPAATVRSIYIYHTYSRGWGDIGYNYLIDHLGNIYEGKSGGEEVYGYHAYTEANAMSVGISLLGNFTSVYPTSAAQNSLIKLMAEKAALLDFDLKYSNGTLSKWLDTNYTVFGHRDAWLWSSSQNTWIINATACPGNMFRSLLSSTITANAQTYKTSHFSNIHTVVSQVNQAMSAPHRDDTLLVLFDRPKTVSESEILSLVPKFSGITDIKVKENLATITIKDWDNGGDSVPPDGWNGYNHPGTFFPSANGSEDRLRTLLKIFKMDPEVKAAELCYSRVLF